jgi:alkylation response protein AidB-like acyl-CoA dehydrogenase
MYSFDPTEEQQMLVDAVNKYAVNDLRPAAREAEENNDLPKKLVSKGWELGLLQASIPESYGGFGERSAVTGRAGVGRNGVRRSGGNSRSDDAESLCDADFDGGQ